MSVEVLVHYKNGRLYHYSSQFSQTLFRVTYFGEHFERIHRYHNMISTISAFQSTPFVLKSTNTLNDIHLGAFKKICEHYDSQVQIYFDHSNVPIVEIML
jgi:hypothetical protein